MQVVFVDIESGFHDAASVRRVMLHVVRNYHRLLAESSDPADFQRTLRSLAFMDRGHGTLVPVDR